MVAPCDVGVELWRGLDSFEDLRMVEHYIEDSVTKEKR